MGLSFLKLVEQPSKEKGANSRKEVYPVFSHRNKDKEDIMIKGGDFYAWYDEKASLWNTDRDEMLERIDELQHQYADENGGLKVYDICYTLGNRIEQYNKFIKDSTDNFDFLDSNKVAFLNTELDKKDRATFRLDYDPCSGSIDNFNTMLHTLYEPEEALKIEYLIGAIATGYSKNLEKMFIFYGAGGSGKSTIIHTITDVLFPGYSKNFRAAGLVNKSDQFAAAPFGSNPLIATDHDGELSKVDECDTINKLISHDPIIINEKHKSPYTIDRPNSVLIMATNKPVTIEDQKSGLVRRIVDIWPIARPEQPFSKTEYNKLKKAIVYERAAIVQHCIDVFNEIGYDAYDRYEPTRMFQKGNQIWNFVSDHRAEYTQPGYFTTKNEQFKVYKTWCEMAGEKPYTKKYFNNQFEDYWVIVEDEKMVDGVRYYGYCSEFKLKKLELKQTASVKQKADDNYIPDWLQLNSTKSILDEELKDCPAVLDKDGRPYMKSWDTVTTTLKDIDTSKVHWVRVPDNLICIDFDIKVNGKKNKEANLKAVIEGGWPITYAEYSQGGEGIHLEYYYDGDLDILANTAGDKDIEIKVYRGKASLRRRVSGCNDIPIAHLSDLPFKKEKKQMIDFNGIKDEMHLRNLINKALRKEIDSITSTHQCVSYIQKVLNDAAASGVKFNLEDMKPKIVSFAMSSTNQATACIQMVNGMIFKTTDEIPDSIEGICNDESDIIFYDVEVFMNVFICCWKLKGEGNPMHRMINPPRHEVAELYNNYKMVGFNNRSYDNHILFAWAEEGYSNIELFRLSQKLVKDKTNSAKFAAAYNLSYTDIMDYYNITEKMKSLKKWEVELGINHVENEYPWDEPLDESHWEEVTDYCCNDVYATEAVWNATQTEFAVRKMLARLAGGKATVNWSTNKLIETIIFGGDKHPQDSFNYRNLAEPCEGQPHFPGYSYKYNDEVKRFESTYKGMVTGEGGLVYARPGMYRNVALLDVASMHPSSIIAENLFGDEYTQRYKEIKESRLCVKHKDLEGLKNKLDGVVYDIIINDHIPEEEFGNLAHALKIVINSVYGLTSATFDNPFRDPRNVDNIVAKRGALFMVDLKEYVESLGYTVAHIKTDSIKIPDCDENIISKVMEFGKKYGYNFELEAIYDRMCLVNNAVYIAKYKEKDGHPCDEWTATGAQFQIPYTFKTLFSGEAIDFKTDLCEIKNVTGDAKMYLDINEDLGPDEHNYVFVGKVGKFTPVKPGYSAGTLYRYTNKDGVDKYDAISGTKGYRFLLSTDLSSNDNFMDMIDYSYFDDYVIKAREEMAKFGDVERFINDDGYFPPIPADPEAVKEELLPF